MVKKYGHGSMSYKILLDMDPFLRQFLFSKEKKYLTKKVYYFYYHEKC